MLFPSTVASRTYGVLDEQIILYPHVPMSDHTLPALSAAIHNSDLTAFWVDVLCVPPGPPFKRSTLESMGFIYSRAKQVIVVLAPRSFAPVQQMSHFLQKGDVPEVELALDILEQDRWIKSVWTYQEVVNSNELYFVGEDTTQSPIDGSAFLNAVGYCLEQYRKAHSLTVLQLRLKYPSLDAFEDLIVDWMLASNGNRSALQLMSNMDRRVYEDPKNYFYSMIGAVTSVPQRRSLRPSIETLADAFMTICEDKGDYSFIFASGPRDVRSGLRWRPRPQMLCSVLPWSSQGEGVSAVKGSGGVKLHDVIVCQHSRDISAVAKSIIAHWLLAPDLETEKTDIVASRFYDTLKIIGFTGSDWYITTDHGLFFSQDEIPHEADTVIWVFPSVRYVFGAPAMAVVDGTQYTPGVFAGMTKNNIPRSDVSIGTGTNLCHQI